MIHTNIFRAYDIRGIYGKEFDLEGAEDIGKAYGTYLLQTSINHGRPLRVCVGRDGRIHSKDITESFIHGVRKTGIEVTDLGLCFSPLLFFSICSGKFDGGVNITASHNPKEYNGFKLQRENAHAIFGDEIQEILSVIERKSFTLSPEIGELKEASFWHEYIRTLTAHPILATSSPKKIVIDAGNGVAGAFAPELFSRFGHKVIPLYCEVDGNFPHHQADPDDPENMKDLQAKVKTEHADFGIAYDGDGDRVGFTDSEGNIYEADELIHLIAEDTLKRNPQSKLVLTVTTKNTVKTSIESLGAKIIETQVGHSYVENAMRAEGALFGGETSGHLFFAEHYYGFDDALFASLLLVKIASELPMSLQEYFAKIPKSIMKEIKKTIPDNEKFVFVEKVKVFLEQHFPCNTIDGVKADIGNDTHILCRASNTSPKVSFRIEAKNEAEIQRAELLLKEFL